MLELDYKESWALKNSWFWTVVLEKTLESPLDSKEIQPVHPKRKSVLNIHWQDWCWSWNSNTLATWCEELSHWKRPWCWERSKAGGEGDDRGLVGWVASLTPWTWVWVNSGSWWWTGKPGMLQSMGSQRVGHDWATEQQRPGRWNAIPIWWLVSWLSRNQFLGSRKSNCWPGPRQAFHSIVFACPINLLSEGRDDSCWGPCPQTRNRTSIDLSPVPWTLPDLPEVGKSEQVGRTSWKGSGTGIQLIFS